MIQGVSVDFDEADGAIGPHLEAVLVVDVRWVAAELDDFILFVHWLIVVTVFEVYAWRYFFAKVLFADLAVVVLVRQQELDEANYDRVL